MTADFALMDEPRADDFTDAPLPPLGPESMTGTWVVAQTLAQHEKRVAAAMNRCDGIGWFLPTWESQRRRVIPLFPKYVFVCLADDDAYYRLLDLRRQISTSFYSIIHVNDQQRLVEELSMVQAAVRTGKVKPYRLPLPGEKCRVTSGSFRGFEGRVDRQHNPVLFIITVSFMGAPRPVAVPLDSLEILDA